MYCYKRNGGCNSFTNLMIVRLTSLALLVGSLFVWLPSAYSAEKLRIGWVYAMGNTPLLVAKYNGFFKQAGVDVEIVQFDSGPLIKRAMKAGDLDLAYIGIPALSRAVADGIDLKIVAKVNYGNAALITKKDSSIRNLGDLRGRKIAGVRKGSGMDILLRGYVLGERAGFDSDKDVTILHMPTKMMDASVNKGVVDAAFTWEPFVSLAVLSDDARVLFDSNQAIPKHLWYVIAARTSILEESRDTVNKVLSAHQRAVSYLRTDTNAGMSIIIDTFKLDTAVKYSQKKIIAEEVVVEARSRLGWECVLDQKDMKFIQRLIDYTQDLGYLKNRQHVDDLIDDESISYLKGIE